MVDTKSNSPAINNNAINKKNEKRIAFLIYWESLLLVYQDKMEQFFEKSVVNVKCTLAINLSI